MNQNLSIALIFTVFASFISLFFFDIVFDDSYDGMISNISNGQFSPFSMMDQHYLGVLVTRDLYKIIQDLLPSINVFATIYLISSILSLFYSLYTINILAQNKFSFVLKLLIALVISILFLENIISITHTRFATIFAGIALINLLYRNLSLKSYSIHFLLFLFGMLTRPESGMGMILIVGLGFLIYNFQPIFFIKKMIAPVLSIIILIAIFYVHRHFTDRFEIKIEPDIEYALSTNRILPLENMKNAEDSLKYEMALSGMFIDTSFTSPSFLKTLVVNQFDFKNANINNSIKNIVFLYQYYNLFLVVIIIILVTLALQKDMTSLIKVLFFSSFIFLLLIYLDNNIAVAERHFVSIQIIASIISLLYLFNRTSFYMLTKNKIYLFWLVLILFSSYSTLKNALGNQIEVAKEVECLESVMENIDKVYQNKYIVASLSTFHLLDRKYTFKNKNYKNNTYLIYDLSNYSIVPRYIEYLSKLCNCNAANPLDFFKWAAEKQVIFIVTKERYNLIEKYIKLKHHQNIVYKDASKIEKLNKPACIYNSIFHNYELKVVVFSNN